MMPAHVIPGAMFSILPFDELLDQQGKQGSIVTMLFIILFANEKNHTFDIKTLKNAKLGNNLKWKIIRKYKTFNLSLNLLIIFIQKLGNKYKFENKYKTFCFYSSGRKKILLNK